MRITASLSAVLAVLALCHPLSAGEPETPKPAEAPSFSRTKIRSPAGDTVWYRFQPGKGNTIGLVQAVLARYGLAHGKHYHLDRQDALGLLCITGSPATVATVRSLIEFLEEERPQIRLRVRIVETSSSRDLQSGFELSMDRKTNEDTFFQGMSVNHEPKAYLDSVLSSKIPYTGSTFDFGTNNAVDSNGNFLSDSTKRWGKVDLQARVIGEHQSSNILAQPDLLVSSGERAEIRNTQNYPYQVVEIQGTTAVVNIATTQLGVTLIVVPHLVGDDRIELSIDASVANMSGYVEIGPGTKYPVISKRTVKTTVLVQSGFEVVFSGLYQKENAVVEKGVPLLSEIPLLGYLFKSYWQVSKKKELLFFLQPRLVSPKARLFTPGE